MKKFKSLALSCFILGIIALNGFDFAVAQQTNGADSIRQGTVAGSQIPGIGDTSSSGGNSSANPSSGTATDVVTASQSLQGDTVMQNLEQNRTGAADIKNDGNSNWGWLGLLGLLGLFGLRGKTIAPESDSYKRESNVATHH